jgi:hypothetical protein
LSLPTPTRSDYGTNRGGAAGRTGKERPSLKMMLTPTAKDNLSCPSMAKWPGARALMELIEQARSMPTPTKSNGGVEPPGKTGRKLVTFLSTPTARDWRSGKASDATFARGTRPLNERCTAVGATDPHLLLAIFEWLMGFPPGFAANGDQPWEMPSSSTSCDPS